jgi:hypothetical protein
MGSAIFKAFSRAGRIPGATFADVSVHPEHERPNQAFVRVLYRCIGSADA